MCCVPNTLFLPKLREANHPIKNQQPRNNPSLSANVDQQLTFNQKCSESMFVDASTELFSGMNVSREHALLPLFPLTGSAICIIRGFRSLVCEALPLQFTGFAPLWNNNVVSLQ